MRVCYFGSFDPGYVRNLTLAEGLRRNGATVYTCHHPLWRDSRDRTDAAARPSAGTAWRVARAQAALLRQYVRMPPHDVLLVGYPGHADMLTARLCARSRRLHVAFDAFLSLYETAVEDRRIAGGALGRALHGADVAAVGLAHLTLLDTAEHAQYFRQSISRRARYAVVPVSAEDDYLAVRPGNRSSGEALRVLYFGAYIPLHGVDVIIEAARLLASEAITVEMIGSGQLLEPTREHVRRLGLNNIRFDTSWHTVPELVGHVARAHVCLGVFAATPKAARVLPNKVVAGLASALPVVTAATPSARAALADGDNALLCPPGDAAALAERLRLLRMDPGLGARVGQGGRQLFRERFCVEAVGRDLLGALRPLVAA